MRLRKIAAEALDGYPVDALLEPYLAALQRNDEAAERAALLFGRVVSAWIDMLAAHIEACSLADTNLFLRLKGRLTETRDALAGLLAQLHGLEQRRLSPREQPAWPQPPAQAH